MYRDTDLLSHHNARKEFYKDGIIRYTFCSKPVFVNPTSKIVRYSGVKKPKDLTNDARADSIRRARKKVFDIAMLNDFDYFVTWTLDASKIDRYNASEVSKKTKIFLQNMVARKNLKYLIVPEYHSDGAIHMHGLSSGDLAMIDSGHTDSNGHVIYNMPDWKYGYSTAIALYGDVCASAKYMTKYVTKDIHKIFGAFYYAGGKGLVRSPDIELFDISYYDIPAKEYPVPEVNIAFKYAEQREGIFK